MQSSETYIIFKTTSFPTGYTFAIANISYACQYKKIT